MWVTSDQVKDTVEGLQVSGAEFISNYKCKFRDFNAANGRAHLLNGDLFYSPNSFRNINAPPPTLYPEGLSCDSSTDCIKDFLETRWWHPQLAYLSFMPRFLDFDIPPFESLFHSTPCFSNNTRGFLMDPQDILKWNTLQQKLLHIVKLLQARSNLPLQHHIISSALCVEWHTSIASLTDQIDRSREWFSVWIGLISFYIAYNMGLCEEDTMDLCPRWFQDLAGKGIEQAFLDSIKSSDVGGFFTPNRVGTFVQLVDPLHRHPPSPEWFFAFNVPVWYPWGQKEVACMTGDDELGRKLKRLCPPPHLMQAATTFLCHPIYPSPALVEENLEEPWVKFFDARAARLREGIPNETARQRQQRNSREKNPPTGKSTKVFVWTKTDGIYRRKRVLQAENLDTLQGFGSNQKVYCPAENEWDCCTKMGELLDEERREMIANDVYIPSRSPSPNQLSSKPSLAGYDEMDAEPLYNESSLPSSSAMSAHRVKSSSENSCHSYIGLAPEHKQILASATDLVPVNLLRSSKVSCQPVPLDNYSTYSFDVSGHYTIEEHEIGEILFRYFGFQPPLPIPANTPLLQLSDDHKRVFCKAVGFGSNYANFFGTPYATLAKHFFDAFSAETYGPPPPNTWDFSPSSRCPLPTLPRLRHLQRISDTFFIFDLGSSREPWYLAVFSAIDALMICRLPDTFSQYEILWELIGRGIRCQTLLPYPSIPPSLPRAVTSCSVRLPGYKWSRSDFEIYKAHARSLLNNPRIERAAVLAGGIVWRIALWLSASLGAVAENPSPAALALHEGFSFPASGPPRWIADDAFDTELNALCGLYLRFNHGSNEPSRLSWFPLDSTWSANFCYPFWTMEANDIFDRRLAELESGNAQPLSASEWRVKIRPASKARRAYKKIETVSLDIIKEITTV